MFYGECYKCGERWELGTACTCKCEAEVEWDINEGPTELHVVVKEFFDKYLHRVEESDGGRMFNPITVNCCRVMMMKPLEEILERMRVLSGASVNPLDRHRSNK